MKKITFLAGLLSLAFATSSLAQSGLQHLASYQTNEEGSAETVAYDAINKHAFFTNSSTNTFTIVDISTPTNPVLVKSVDLSSYGAGPNSIAVHENLVAVAIEDHVKQDPGAVVFFDLDGNFIKQITAGALPDMLTFTPDCSKLLVANEGEPSDDYSVDPEGSITIIDITSGIASATASHINFNDYDDKKESLKNKGIRIFGNNGAATVSQDLEPEYITVTEDGTKAFVSCQENNAFIVLDLTTHAILDILPLGYKNHLLGTPTVSSYVINELEENWPALGAPIYDGGQPTVMLGGFSGLFFDEANSTANEYVFYAVPDRGPNDATASKADVIPAASQNLRPFKLPDYQGRIAKFTFNKTTGDIALDEQIMLTRKDGTTPISGKGNIPGVDEVPVTYTDASTAYNNADYVHSSTSEEYHELAFDPYGGDFEGILIDKDGKFWMCDEYRPAIYKFEPNGQLIERYVASGTSLLGTTPQVEGYYGAETLPAVYSKRWANRGFEAIAYDENSHIIYAFIQSPLDNPDSATVRNKTDVIRILGISADNGVPVSEHVYLLERNKDAGYAASRVDKIGDAVYTGNGKFLVIERDSEGPEADYGKKYIFEIDINQATNVLNMFISGGKELEEMSADELVAQNILPVHKNKVVNLPSIGYVSSDKAEGIALLPNNEIAVINDNDFGLAGAGITDNSVLGIISFANDYGFDASNEDGAIDIKQHPTLGMFMPDAIASYNVGGMNYIVTANEGDSRDYGGYSEEVRVKDLTLNPVYYPNATTLQEDENLGRLKTTIANGDYDNDGTYEQIYSYGGRSFSIFDQYGNIVFDSGDQFGQKIASEEPLLFNEDEEELDGRSDDKGGEPEAIAVAEIDGTTFAFIGLERQSAILMFDITNPKDVEFITYYKHNRISGDMAPEIIKFVPATDSPNSKNLLLVGYEVSGSLGIIEIGDEALNISQEVAENNFKIYPNPVVNSNLKFNKSLSGAIFNINGQEVKRFIDQSAIEVSDLTSGIYVLKTQNHGVKRFVKL